jgi:hypothetical protein
MSPPMLDERRDRLRQLSFFREPRLWPRWPFLPVVRRADGVLQFGLMFDARGASGAYGYSATVFRTNLFVLPATAADLLALLKEVFDTAEEVHAAGWRVD